MPHNIHAPLPSSNDPTHETTTGSLDVLGSPTVMLENLGHGFSDLVQGAGFSVFSLFFRNPYMLVVIQVSDFNDKNKKKRTMGSADRFSL
jgi:hypothetical protein